MFPGRFLEEIDEQVDMTRIERIRDLRRIRGVEERLKLYRAGKLSNDAISGDHNALSEHERLLQEYSEYS